MTKVVNAVLLLLFLLSENLREDFLPENGRFHCHFWSENLNFDARSVLSTSIDAL